MSKWLAIGSRRTKPLVMEIFLPILLFVLGFGIGGFAVWQMKQKELEARHKSDKDLEATFGNLSRQALSENQQQFLELAKNEFEKLQS
ncbi:MAG: hypothetical protein QGF46_08940, partial [Planctomycetota bacterium]|nr:hypothetical protein [Planctomycetota bacterium]